MNKILPPQLALILAALGVGLGLTVPLVGPAPAWVRLAGVPVLLAGLGIAVAGSRQFRRAETNIDTFADPDVLVTTGLFARSRNPMYLGMLAFVVGVALLTGGLTAWMAPLGFFVVCSSWYIPFEERRMESAFGDRYEAYRRQVPRWIGLHAGRRPSAEAPAQAKSNRVTHQ